VPSEKRARQRAAREARLAAEARSAKRRKQIRNAIIVVVVAGVIIGIVFLVSNNKPGKSTTSTTASSANKTDAQLQSEADAAAVKAGCPSSTKTTVNTQKYASAPPMTLDTSKTYTATVKTTTGTFDIALDAKTAPQTVNNFVFLANKGFYHCVVFHRVIPQFMNQTGDPTGTGSGGPGYTIPDEYPPKASNPAAQYPVGSVAMANTGQPHSGGSQWFVVAGPQGESLPNTYTLFGTVSSGMSVVNTINKQGNSSPSSNGVPPAVTQRILSVTIHES
jgi:cyclophilin family peptidyl-prolyl cis-trans isomerase